MKKTCSNDEILVRLEISDFERAKGNRDLSTESYEVLLCLSLCSAKLSGARERWFLTFFSLQHTNLEKNLATNLKNRPKLLRNIALERINNTANNHHIRPS